MSIEIAKVDPSSSEVARILTIHHNFCVDTTCIENVYALEASKLVSPDITVFGAYKNGELVGVGAIRMLDSTHGELKSMHTLASARGQGIGRAMVNHIIDFALSKGARRLSLETGSNDAFKPARELYISLGFKSCDAFGDNKLSEDNICMTKLL